MNLGSYMATWIFFRAVSLVGQSAPPEVLQKLTYLVLSHPQVKRIDTVRAYTFGVLYFVEVSHCHILRQLQFLQLFFPPSPAYD